MELEDLEDEMLDEEGTSTDDDYSDDEDDNAAEAGSVLADSKSIFNSTARNPINPVITRAEEHRQEASAGAGKAGASTALVPSVRKLVAVFDQNGAMQVAYAVNGRQVEAFRAPTKQEWDMVKARGYLVKGGLGEGTPAAAAAETLQIPWKPILIGGAVLAAAGGAYWYWQHRKEGGASFSSLFEQRAARRNPREEDEDDGDEDDSDDEGEE